MAPYIADAVRSVQSQNIEDVEIIVVDDGSTDETPAILQRLARTDSRIQVIRQSNAGAAAARNTGLQVATGELITFLDGDDLYESGKLERQLRVLVKYPEVGLVFHDLARFTEDRRYPGPPHLHTANFLSRVGEYFDPVGSTLYLGKPDAYKILTIDYLGISTISVMFRRHLLEPGEQPFKTDLRVAEDLDLWHRLIRRTRIAYLDEQLALYRQHPSSTMATVGHHQLKADDHRVRAGYLRKTIRELNREEWLRYRALVAESWFELGYGSFSIGRAATARVDYLHAFRARPHLRPLIAFFKTFAPSWAVRRVRSWRAAYR